ncbi:hypothetical protein QZH41_004829 [Actinostola sp. cb2023]|nr:hypothetical protein QZH41_004829 [Actinostola sp. cb2023]
MFISTPKRAYDLLRNETRRYETRRYGSFAKRGDTDHLRNEAIRIICETRRYGSFAKRGDTDHLRNEAIRIFCDTRRYGSFAIRGDTDHLRNEAIRIICETRRYGSFAIRGICDTRRYGSFAKRGDTDHLRNEAIRIICETRRYGSFAKRGDTDLLRYEAIRIFCDTRRYGNCDQEGSPLRVDVDERKGQGVPTKVLSVPIENCGISTIPTALLSNIWHQAAVILSDYHVLEVDSLLTAETPGYQPYLLREAQYRNENDSLQKLNDFLATRDCSPVRYCAQNAWSEAAERTKREHLRKIKQGWTRADPAQGVEFPKPFLVMTKARQAPGQRVIEDWERKNLGSYYIVLQSKALQGLDNISADGLRGVEVIEKVVKKLGERGKSSAWVTEVINSLMALKRHIGSLTGIAVKRYDFSEPQAGKGPCDRSSAHQKAHVNRCLNEGNDIISAEDIKKALELHGGVKNVVPYVIELPECTNKSSPPRIQDISLLHNYQYSDKGLRMWKAFDIGEGKLVSWQDLDKDGLVLPLDLRITESGTINDDRVKQYKCTTGRGQRKHVTTSKEPEVEEEDESVGTIQHDTT